MPDLTPDMITALDVYSRGLEGLTDQVSFVGMIKDQCGIPIKRGYIPNMWNIEEFRATLSSVLNDWQREQLVKNHINYLHTKTIMSTVDSYMSSPEFSPIRSELMAYKMRAILIIRNYPWEA